MAYVAPLKEMNFVLKHVAEIDEVIKLSGYKHVDSELLEAVLEEASKLASDSWDKTNIMGDNIGSQINNGEVKTPEGFKEAYKQFAEGGWKSIVCNENFGGQNLPWAIGMAVDEMWQSANLSLSLCPLLSQAAIEAIEQHGTEEQKNIYLEKIISGEWTGTMQLTEPQAGTDLAAIRTLAKKDGEHYLLSGQKIFITWGEHDFTDNIIHLVLARVDGLPEGNNGLGLFIVPKFLVNKDGSLGERNDLKAVSIEHKLGIHGSPTCVMSYGENSGAIGYLIGEEGKGLHCMFTMMNNARISVGLQGVALAERAYQHALDYAKERFQCTKLGSKSDDRVAIIEHADVRRMLLTMKANNEASRALAYYAGSMIDRLRKEKDETKRENAKARVDFLTPIVKAWSTDLAVETSSMGIQIHGGMGFIEETGAAQYYRDARILPIYEGTNGIQANDFIFRKVLRDGGSEATQFITEINQFLKKLEEYNGGDLSLIKDKLFNANMLLEELTSWVVTNSNSELDVLSIAAVPYLKIFSIVAGGFMLAKLGFAAQKEIDNGNDDSFYKNKIITAKFYCESILPQVKGLEESVTGGCNSALEISNDGF